MKWLTVGICFTLVLFWSRSGQADVIEGYHLLQSSAVRLIRSEGASDVQPASSINASQQILSHMPRTLAWVTRSVNLSEPLISQATSKMSSATANVSTGGEFSSNSVSNVPRIAGNVFISEPSDARLPLNAYPADSAGNGSVQAQSNTSQYGQGKLACICLLCTDRIDPCISSDRLLPYTNAHSAATCIAGWCTCSGQA